MHVIPICRRPGTVRVIPTCLCPQTDCTGASTEGRDGEMHFVVVPSSRQRRLVPVPAAVWRSGFLAGYDPALDATAVAMGPADGE